jgi:hypothetical protein
MRRCYWCDIGKPILVTSGRHDIGDGRTDACTRSGVDEMKSVAERREVGREIEQPFGGRRR